MISPATPTTVSRGKTSGSPAAFPSTGLTIAWATTRRRPRSRPRSPVRLRYQLHPDAVRHGDGSCYAPYLQSMVYAYGNIITSENITNANRGDAGGPVTGIGGGDEHRLLQGHAVLDPGRLHLVKPTALTAAFLAPTQATTPTGVVSFYIANTGTIYYSTAAAIRSCDLTGGADALVKRNGERHEPCTDRPDDDLPHHGLCRRNLWPPLLRCTLRHRQGDI